MINILFLHLLVAFLSVGECHAMFGFVSTECIRYELHGGLAEGPLVSLVPFFEHLGQEHK